MCGLQFSENWEFRTDYDTFLTLRKVETVCVTHWNTSSRVDSELKGWRFPFLVFRKETPSNTRNLLYCESVPRLGPLFVPKLFTIEERGFPSTTVEDSKLSVKDPESEKYWYDPPSQIPTPFTFILGFEGWLTYLGENQFP